MEKAGQPMKRIFLHGKDNAGEITMKWNEILKKEWATYDEINQEWIDAYIITIISGQLPKYTTLWYSPTDYRDIKKPKEIASFVQRSGKRPNYTHLSIEIKLNDKNDFPINPETIQYNHNYHYDIKVIEQKDTEDGLKTRKKEFKFN